MRAFLENLSQNLQKILRITFPRLPTTRVQVQYICNVYYMFSATVQLLQVKPCFFKTLQTRLCTARLKPTTTPGANRCRAGRPRCGDHSCGFDCLGVHNAHVSAEQGERRGAGRRRRRRGERGPRVQDRRRRVPCGRRVVARVQHSVDIENQKIQTLGKIDQFGAILPHFRFCRDWHSVKIKKQNCS